MLPELIDGNLAYCVELHMDCLYLFVVSIMALNEALTDKIVVNNTSGTNKLVLRKKETNKQNRQKGKNFISTIDFNIDDLTVVSVQLSCNDLSILIHKFLEHILGVTTFYFELKCQDSLGRYNHFIHWWCS
ncbi:MAG: hypothetical protein LBJ00_14575 [Planctomycetaceae bacterium]|nr:hypothetical protein [Planctomycetaceae bacterium]